MTLIEYMDQVKRLRAEGDRLADTNSALSAENKRLRAQRDALSASLQGGITERDMLRVNARVDADLARQNSELRAQRDALLAALKTLVANNEDYCRNNCLFDKHGNLASDTNQDMVQARAAIKEAGG